MRRTSVETYQAIMASGILKRARWQVYAFLFHNGPMTGREMKEKGKEKYGREFQESADKRLSELREMGAVYEVRERACTVTGRTAIEWDVTDRMPKKIEPRKTGGKTIAQVIEEARKEGYQQGFAAGQRSQREQEMF